MFKNAYNNRRLYMTKNSITLELRNFRLRLSNPTIQAFDEKIFENKDDIMHFYYNIELFQQNREKEWKLIAENYVTEFGTMRYLGDFVNNVLNTNMNEKNIREDYEDDGSFYELVKPFDMAGLLNEDSITIVRHYKTFKEEGEKKECEFYDITVSVGQYYDSGAMVGTTLRNLEREDIKMLGYLGDSFIRQACLSYKKEI